MKNRLLLVALLILLIAPLTGDTFAGKSPEKYLGRIGFVQEISPEEPDQANSVDIGIEVKENVIYKLISAAGEVYVSAGMLSRGINTIPIPIDLIINENKGVFYLHLKSGRRTHVTQIVLVTDRYDVMGKSAGEESGDVLKDKYTHEVVVSGMNDSGIDMHNRIVWDAVTGDFPGLTQGISVLPILYLLGSKIYRSLKKKKKRIFPLYSQTEVSTDIGQKKGQVARLSLGIHITDI